MHATTLWVVGNGVMDYSQGSWGLDLKKAKYKLGTTHVHLRGTWMEPV